MLADGGYRPTNKGKHITTITGTGDRNIDNLVRCQSIAVARPVAVEFPLFWESNS